MVHENGQMVINMAMGQYGKNGRIHIPTAQLRLEPFGYEQKGHRGPCHEPSKLCCAWFGVYSLLTMFLSNHESMIGPSQRRAHPMSSRHRCAIQKFQGVDSKQIKAWGSGVHSGSIQRYRRKVTMSRPRLIFSSAFWCRHSDYNTLCSDSILASHSDYNTQRFDSHGDFR